MVFKISPERFEKIKQIWEEYHNSVNRGEYVTVRALSLKYGLPRSTLTYHFEKFRAEREKVQISKDCLIAKIELTPENKVMLHLNEYTPPEKVDARTIVKEKWAKLKDEIPKEMFAFVESIVDSEASTPYYETAMPGMKYASSNCLIITMSEFKKLNLNVGATIRMSIREMKEEE